MKDENYEWELAHDYYKNKHPVQYWIIEIKYQIKRFIRRLFKNEDIPF